MPAIGRKCLAFLLTAVMLFSLAGTAAAETRPGGPPASPFWDTYGTKFQQALDNLYALGIVSGKSQTSFDPNGAVTRAEMAALVIRALGMKPGAQASSPFPDVPASHWAAGTIALASSEGVVRGADDGRFHPDDPVTYPQVVAMLVRATGLEPQAGSYPVGYILLAKNTGMIDGVDWGMDKPASRGDVAIMLNETVFHVKRGGTGATLSQSVFKRPGGVQILPEADVVAQGSTQLSAKVVDWVGQPLDLPVRWSISDIFSTINDSGMLTVNGGGPITVEAQTGGITVSRTFAVVRSIAVQASSAAAKLGDQVQMNAVGMGPSGKEVDIKPVWSVVSGTGTISADGLLTIQGSAPIKVRATVGSLTADATVSVVGGISISPATALVSANGEVQFSATVVDSQGNRVSAPLTWSLTGGGTIDQNGKFRAGTAPATVSVKSGDSIATATVDIVNRLEVSPNGGSFEKGDVQQFTATVYKSGNQVVPVSVTWSVEPSTLGIVDSSGNFFANNAGSGYVVASYGELKTRVPVSVAGQATAIRLSASPTTLPANGHSKSVITAKLIDSSGNIASGATSIMFALSNTKLGTLDKTVAKVENGVATANLSIGTVAGTYTIYASAPGTSLPGTTMYYTATAPSVDHIDLEVYPNPVAADGISQTTVTAKLIDSSGGETFNNTSQSISIVLSSSSSTPGHLNSYNITIGPGQSSGSVFYTSSARVGSTVISGTSNYRVNPITLTSQTVGDAYRLKLHTNGVSVKADGTSEMVVQAEVQDVNGNIRTSDSNFTVAMSAVSGTSTISVPSQVVKWGVATFRLKTTKAGTYTLNVWSVGNALLTDSTTVTFGAGIPAKLSLSVEPNTIIAADGNSVATLKAKILDVNGNVVTDASNTVKFIRDEGDIVTTLPRSPEVAAIDGVASYSLTAKTIMGSDTFHAEADGLTASGTVTVTTTITGVPVAVAVQSLAQRTATVGQPVEVRVWVVDGSDVGRLVSSDNGRVVYLFATNGAQVSGPTTTLNGVATFTVTPTRSGNISLTATGAGLESDDEGKVLTAIAGAPDHIVLSATPEGLNADGVSRATIKATLVDQYGNAVSGGYPIALSASSNQYLTLSSTTLSTGGQVSVTSTTTPGTTTITGSAGSYVVLPITIGTYKAGPPSKVVLDPVPNVMAGNGLGNQAVIKARIVDDAGNPATSLNTGSDLSAMALRITDSAGTNNTIISMPQSSGLNQFGIVPNGSTIGAASVTAGVASFTITNTKAETVTLTPIVFYRGMQLEGVPATLTTTAGPAGVLTVRSSSAAVSSTSPTDVTISAQITDNYGNPVVSSDDTFTFSVSNALMVSLPAQTTVPALGGSASIVARTNSYSWGGTATVTVRSGRTGLVGTVSIVLDELPDQPEVSVKDSAGADTTVTSGDAGARVYVSVSARKSNQQVVVYVNGVSVPLYTSTAFDAIGDTIAPGNQSLTGYIRKIDLGGAGIKDVRVVIVTPLGISPMSDSQTLTVR